MNSSLVPNTNINIPQSSNSIQLNPHDYLNKGINDITLEYFNLISPENKKSIKTLFLGVGILIGADIIKSIIQSLIRDNHKNINDTILSCFKFFSFSNLNWYWYQTKFYFHHCNLLIFNHMEKFNIFKKKKSTDYNDEQVDKSKYTGVKKSYIKIRADDIFFNNLISFIENYKFNKMNYEQIKDVNFKEIYDDEINIDTNNIVHVKNLSDILIDFNNISIHINKISYLLSSSSNEYKIKHNNELLFFDFMIKKHDFIDKMHIYTELKSIADNYTIEQNEGFCYIIKSLFDFDNLPENDKLVFKVNLSCVNFILNYNQKICHDKYIQNLLSLLSIDKIYIGSFGYMTSRMLEKIINWTSDVNINFITMLDEFYELLHNHINFNRKKTNNEKIQKNISSINFIISCNKDFTNEEINKNISDFINYIQIISKKHKSNKKVNIYTVKVQNDVIVEEIENPKYAQYIQSKKLLVEEKKSLEDIIKLIGVEPEKIISSSKIEKKVEKNFVNSKYCSFENLYLRKKQDLELYQLVERFSNDKNLMEELGIPNKLGILLYGEPGCGKTTTIITIASYFGRDIFYINLKSIKTNEELKLVFDYINSQHLGGGIVVLEDIDAMSNIVEKRVRSKTNIVDLINSADLTNTVDLVDSKQSEITLEYLLNLLDGTLTFNDSIVIITTNHLEKLDPAIYRSGRIDALIEMKKCDHYQIQKIYKRFIKRDICPKILQLVNEDMWTPAQIIFHLMNWVKKINEVDNVIMNDFITND